MHRTALDVPCASIPRRSQSLEMKKRIAFCVGVIARLMLCRKKFEPGGLRELVMRISLASATLFLLSAAALLVSFVSAGPQSSDRVSVTVDEEQRRVDVPIEGQPFTSYVWPDELAKPVLYPLHTAKGTIITRGFPLEQRPGERVDHPHHAGLWFNYENVNGIDFWNNSDAIKPENAPKMGTILHRSIVSAKSGTQSGELEVDAEWGTFEKKVLLKEQTHCVFRGGPGFPTLDPPTPLRPLEHQVHFKDEKDGLLVPRVVRALEIPPDKPEVYT